MAAFDYNALVLKIKEGERGTTYASANQQGAHVSFAKSGAVLEVAIGTLK